MILEALQNVQRLLSVNHRTAPGHLQICCLSIVRTPTFILSALFIFSSWLSSPHPCAPSLSLFLSPSHLLFPLLHGTVLL